MLSDLDNFYLSKEEPVKGCLLALKDIIVSYNFHISAQWKYKLPFFYYKKTMLCYLWVRKQTGQPYIGWVDGNKIDHPLLLTEKRARMKILLVDPGEDLPLETIREILGKAIKLKD